MAGNVNHIPETWLSLLGGRDASGWLSAFIEAPQKAVSDLLRDAFYFGALNLTDREQLLQGWLDLLGNNELFAERLDTELTSWVEENWGHFEHSAESLISAWSCLCGIVEFSAKLPEDSQLKNCASALQARFVERQQFLGNFSFAPAADPLGLYLAVVAEFQGEDRSLATFWHRMCDLQDDVPFYHARYALLGLRRLKAEDPVENGTLRAEVVLGLLRLARAFDRLERQRRLPANIAKATFRRVAAQTAAAYPNSAGWAKHGLAMAMELPERAQKWLTEAVNPLAEAIQQQKNQQRQGLPRKSIEAEWNWPRRAHELSNSIRRGDLKCLPNVKLLLDEERRYAEATGDTHHIVRSLSSFASRILHFSPRLALSWAEEARQSAPYDSVAWDTVRKVLLSQKQIAEALRFAWVAWKRFPEDVVTYNGLAEVLKAAQRYDEAEAIYREAIDHFPNDVVSRNALADLLKKVGKFDQAVAIYRDTIKRFSDDFIESVIARNGLAGTFRSMGLRGKAEAAYRSSIKSGHFNAITFISLAHLVLKKDEAGRVEALALINRALELDPRNRYAQQIKQQLKPTKGANPEALLKEWEQITVDLFGTPELPVAEFDNRGSEHEDALPLKVEDPQPSPKQTKPTSPEQTKPGTKTAPSTASSAKDAITSTKETIPEEQEKTKLLEQEGVQVLEEEQPSPEQTTVLEAETHVRPQHETETKRPFLASNPFIVAALVAESYFFRAWAKLANSDETAAIRRQKSAELIASAQQLSPQDALVLAEINALAADEGDELTAYENLTKQLRSHPAAAPLLVLKARLDRKRAREEMRRLSVSTLDELCVFPQRLREVNSTLAPLFHFQKGLAALALLDGNERKEIVVTAFSRFRHLLAYLAAEEHKEREINQNTRKSPRFHEWLQAQVERRVFSGGVETEKRDIDLNDISFFDVSWLQHRAVEEVEDVFIDRLSYSSI